MGCKKKDNNSLDIIATGLECGYETCQILGVKDGRMTGWGLYLVVMYDGNSKEKGERSFRSAIPLYLNRPYSGELLDIPMMWPSEKIEKYLKEELGWDRLPKSNSERQFIDRLKKEKGSKLQLNHIITPITRDFINKMEEIRVWIKNRVTMTYKEPDSKLPRMKDLYIVYSVAYDADNKFQYETYTPIFIGDGDNIRIPLNWASYGFDEYIIPSDSQYILSCLNINYKEKKGEKKKKKSLEFECQRITKMVTTSPPTTPTVYMTHDVVVEDDIVYWGDESNMVDRWLKSLEVLVRDKKHPSDEPELLWDWGNGNVSYGDFYRPMIKISHSTPYNEKRDIKGKDSIVEGKMKLPHRSMKIAKVFPVRLNKYRIGEVGFNYYT